MRVCAIVIAVTAVVITASSAALAGWTVTSLQPEGTPVASATATWGGSQVGALRSVDGNMRAAMWSGSSQSCVSLHPSGYSTSDAKAIWGSQQAGSVTEEDTESGMRLSRAVVWNGSASDYTIIHPFQYRDTANPDGLRGSSVNAMWNSQKAGIVLNSDDNQNKRACWWNGGAESFVLLNPSDSYVESTALAVENGWQAGYAGTCYGKSHAALWHGTAGSFVDLHPAGCFRSEVHGISSGRQVGFTVASIMESPKAAMWSGTAASCVSLNPTGFVGSVANAISGEYQVGFAQTADYASHAGMWSGDADSWFDLSSLLGPGCVGSEATSIEAIGDEMWITGSAAFGPGDQRAVLWHHTVPEPASLLALATGLLGLCVRRRRGGE